MLAPIRSLLSPRPGSAVVLVTGAAAVSLMFAATPFLIPEIARRYGVALGTAGLISAVQVLGFASTNLIAGRMWRPTRSKLLTAAVVGMAASAASALSGLYWLLLVLRFVAGAAAGVFTWLAWADAMRDARSMRSISAVGPFVALVGSPILAWIVAEGGVDALYWTLAVTPLPVLLMPSRGIGGEVPVRRRMSPSRSNVVLLIALGAHTMAGSSLFIFLGAVATQEIGLTAGVAAIGLSINAAAGFAGARWRRRPRHGWPWLLAITVAAPAIVVFPNVVVYYAGMVVWGFAFWMAVPQVLSSIAAWSAVPEERVGDAQSIMAFGRVLGPLAGGLLVGFGSFIPLGVFAAVAFATAALLAWLVDRYRAGEVAPAHP